MELPLILTSLAVIFVFCVVAFVLDEHWKENHGSNHF